MLPGSASILTIGMSPALVSSLLQRPSQDIVCHDIGSSSPSAETSEFKHAAKQHHCSLSRRVLRQVSINSEAGPAMHAQAKHVHMEASSRDEIKRLKSQIAGLRGENQHLRAETQRLHSNLATTQLQLRHYGQQVLCSWLRLLTAHAYSHVVTAMAMAAAALSGEAAEVEHYNERLQCSSLAHSMHPCTKTCGCPC